MSWRPPPTPPPPPPVSGPRPAADEPTGYKEPAAREELEDYYQLLQVDPKSHTTIIRYAYRFLAAMYHPDNSDSGDENKFKILTRAWSVLSDSGKRLAYDAQLGLRRNSATAGGGTPETSGATREKEIEHPSSLSWNEVELRLSILQVLMEARRKRPQSGGASARMLMDCLNCQLSDIEYVLWYLREKGYILRTEASFMITIQGVDYLVDQLSKTQPMNPKKDI